MLTLDNLYFRRPNMDDVAVIAELKNNEQAAFLLGGIQRHYTHEDIKKWIQFHNSNPNELLLVVEDLDKGKLIGHVGLYDIDRIARKTEFGILIADDESRGKGYGTKATSIMVDYAFNVLGMHKVTAKILNENIPSISMFKKCGFSIDGCLRDDVYKNDRFYDVICMSILNNTELELSKHK